MRKQVATAGAGFAALTGGWFVGNFGIMGACFYDACLYRSGICYFASWDLKTKRKVRCVKRTF